MTTAKMRATHSNAKPIGEGWSGGSFTDEPFAKSQSSRTNKIFSVPENREKSCLPRPRKRPAAESPSALRSLKDRHSNRTSSRGQRAGAVNSCFFSQCHYPVLSYPCQTRYQWNPWPRSTRSREHQRHRVHAWPRVASLVNARSDVESAPRPQQRSLSCAPKASSRMGSGRFHRHGALPFSRVLIRLIHARLMCCFGFPAQIEYPTWSVEIPLSAIGAAPPAAAVAKKTSECHYKP
jgi:hypothetical protein